MQRENRSRPLGTVEVFRRQREANRRLVILGVLCLLVPPIGLLCLWRSGYVSSLLKGIYSLATLLVMTLVLTLLRSGGEAPGVSPTPYVPTLVGYSAVAPAVTAAPVQSQTTITYDEPEDEGVVVVPPAATVYAADGIDGYYHAAPDSDGRETGRALTLSEAQAEGLTPCPDCYPDSDSQ